MSPADWRALLEALLDGRLSPEAFSRRFLDGLRTAQAQGFATPASIRDMVAAVEAFDADSAGRDEYEINADELHQAARTALSQLHDAQPAPRTFDRARAREDMARFRVQVSGCAGLGCLIAFAWVALCVLQINYVSVEIQTVFGWDAWPSAVVGFFLAFVPILGNVLAYLGATERGWTPLVAAIVFFAAPAATMLSGWARWRRFR